jgi:regulator of replication initiation timing
MTDTSTEAVERLILLHETAIAEALVFHTQQAADNHHLTANTLRALAAERDRLRAEVASILAENDALRFTLNNANAAQRLAVERARGDALEEAARAVEAHRFEREQMMVVEPGRHGFQAIHPRDAKDYLAAAIRAIAGAPDA